jgi:hypothetical protein
VAVLLWDLLRPDLFFHFPHASLNLLLLAYRVALIDLAGNQTLWRSGNLKAIIRGERKAGGLTFSLALLKPLHYILRSLA